MDATNANLIQGRAPLRASATLRSVLSSFGKKTGNLSFVYGPKVQRDWVVTSDLELFHFVSLEGSPDVESYDLDPERIVAFLDKAGYVGIKPDATVRNRSGSIELVEVKYEQHLKNDVRTQFQVAAQKKAASRIGATWSVYTDENATTHERWVQDWIDIIVAMSEVRFYSLQFESECIRALITRKKKLDLRALAHNVKSEWLLVFSAIFGLVQTGELESDLAEHPLSWGTEIKARRR